MIDGQQVRSVARLRIADGARDRLLVLVVMLGERRVEELDDRDVEPVEPEHRLVGLVAVVVPGHRRRDDEVAVVHRRAFAVDGGVGAVALEDEAQRALAVPMCGRDLARKHQLDAGVEVGRDLRLAAQAGILEDQHPALGFFGGDQAPASIIAARISANDHDAGWQPLTGSGVTSFASDVHSGVRCFWPMRS